MDLKNKRGVTFISLMITIIALMILSSITIGTLTGDSGIITRAENAKNDTIIGGKVEDNTLKDYQDLIDNAMNYLD